MTGVNRVILIGNLGGDPELRHTKTSGSAVCTFRIATTETWSDKSGAKQQRTEWHRIVVWGRHGEQCGEYLKKGRLVCVEGRLQTREWEQDGTKRQIQEVIADRVTFLPAGHSAGSAEASSSKPKASLEESYPDDADIPF